MDEIKALAREKEHEYLMLKWAGEQDIKEYLAGLEKQRWDSLAFRNAEGKCYREIEEEESRQKVQEASQEEVIQAALSFVVKLMFLTNRKIHLNPIEFLFLNF